MAGGGSDVPRAGADIRFLMSARFAAANLRCASAISPKRFATRNRRLQKRKSAPARDKNISYQQNLQARKIAFVVLGNQQWPTLRRYVEKVVAAINAATPGSFVEVEIPLN